MDFFVKVNEPVINVNKVPELDNIKDQLYIGYFDKNCNNDCKNWINETCAYAAYDMVGTESSEYIDTYKRCQRNIQLFVNATKWGFPKIKWSD
jgi:hypothetical protein